MLYGMIYKIGKSFIDKKSVLKKYGYKQIKPVI